MIALLVAFLINQKTNHDQATGVFAKIADIDWGSDLSFQEKVGSPQCPATNDAMSVYHCVEQLLACVHTCSV